MTWPLKYSVARVRPYAYYGHSDTGRDDHLSFWSGHTVVAFSAAAAGGTLARMRGYGGWPWVYAAGFTGAALTGYFRMASDKHWLTDVLASAAAGTGIGILVPWLHRVGPGGTSYLPGTASARWPRRHGHVLEASERGRLPGTEFSGLAARPCPSSGRGCRGQRLPASRLRLAGYVDGPAHM